MMRHMAALAAVASMATALALALAPAARAQSALPVVKFCSGPKDGNYDFSGIQIALQAKGTLKIQLINTAGSLENLQKLDNGECDAAIVQSDAYNVYLKQNSHSSLNLELGRVLYDEYVHFICNANAGLSSIVDLTPKNTVLIGPNGGGSAVTWESFKIADPKRYGAIPTQPIGGLRAASQVQEGSVAQCMFDVIGLKAPGINEINALAAQSGGRMVLVPAGDSDMPGVKDPRGKVMYAREAIPGGTYPKGLQPSSLFGSSVNTIAVHAVFVANSGFIDAHEADYTALLRAVNAAENTILQRVKPS